MFRQNRNRRNSPHRGRRFSGGRGRGIFKKAWTPGNTTKSKATTGPAECSIPELENHYFDCGSIHEADRFITTNKAIIAYMGSNFGGDIKTTLENCEVFKIPEPEDPTVTNGLSDILDADGRTIRSEKEQVGYKEQRKFDCEMSSFIKRKEKLANLMEKSYNISQSMHRILAKEDERISKMAYYFLYTRSVRFDNTDQTICV